MNWNWFKKRNNQIIIGVFVLLLLVGGYFFVFNKSKSPTEDIVQDQTVQTISAEELGLELIANPANNEVKFLIAKADKIKSIDYELTYEADSSAADLADGAEPRVQRGVSGHADLVGESEYESEFLVLGSESAGTKRYDKGVESVSITLKIVKKDGKIYSAEKTLDL